MTNSAQLDRPARLGLLANTCALGSLLMCFGQVGIAFVLGAIGLASDPMARSVEHVQALLMWVLAALVVLALNQDRRQHGEWLPMALSGASFVLMVATLYGAYHWSLLTLAYLLLIAAVLLNQNAALRALYRTIKRQAAELATHNLSLQGTITEEVAKNERLKRLERFLSPQVAQLVTSPGHEHALESHRRRIAVLFCDLRGFTAFSDSAEPEETMELLQRYHEIMGRLVDRFEGTIDHRAGDGLMVVFNDPLPVEDPVGRAIDMAVEMREQAGALLQHWKRLDFDLGFGVGIAYGYATLGLVGFEGRYDYTANGNAVNLAARLCDEAGDGQILLSQAALAAVEGRVDTIERPKLTLKGFREPVSVHELVGR